MSKIVQSGVRKLPTMLGAGIMAVSLVGITFAVAGLTLSLGVELASAAIGMAVGSRYA